MSTALLSIDEIGTIKLYSAQGASKVITNYGLAKNHILFNLANSLLPGSNSFNPFRARMLSLVAVTCTWAALAWMGWKRKCLLEYGLIAGMIGLNQQLLQLNFQARGYGFIFCFALIGSLALCEYLRTGRYLWLLGLTTILGTYTVPSYLVFGGSLMLLLFLTTRRATVFRAGFLTFGVTLFLYFPVLGQLMHVSAGYDDSYGEAYKNFGNVCSTLAYCIPPFWEPRELGFFVLLIGFALAPLLLKAPLRHEWRAMQLLLTATGIFIAFCLFLKTPPPRVTAFLAAPLLVTSALTAGATLRHPVIRWLQPLAAALLFGSLSWFGLKTIRNYEFDPRSNLAEVGQMAINLAPTNGVVWVSSGQTNYKVYLEKICPVIVGKLPHDLFRNGRALLIEDVGSSIDASLADMTQQTPGALMFPVLRGNRLSHRIWFTLPPAYDLLALTLNNLPADPNLLDRDFETGLLLPASSQFRCQPTSLKIRSLNLWSKNGWEGATVTVRIETADHKPRPLPQQRLLIEAQTVSVDLHGLHASAIIISLLKNGHPIELNEVFAITDP